VNLPRSGAAHKTSTPHKSATAKPGARSGWTRGPYARLSLRGRFALLAAVAVSVAVVGAALASYFLVEAQLNNQVNSQLSRGPNGSPVSAPGHGPGIAIQTTSAEVMADCLQKSQYQHTSGAEFFDLNEEIVGADGQHCQVSGKLEVPLSATQTSVAAQAGIRAETVARTGAEPPPDQSGGVYYDTHALTGEHVRVYTAEADDGPYAYAHIISLAPMDSSLNTLMIELSVAAIAGIFLATVAGLVVARSAVKPVRRLTRAVEHVAKTEDLSVKLPVSGRDEVNRLSAAFNKMTKALATSRDRQRRLIADAGHELRTPLTSLRTNVDLLLRSERTGRQLPPGRRESMLESVDQQLHELSGLVTDLLELSRGQEGGTRRTMRVALHESVARAVERAKLRGPGLRFDVHIEPWYVQGEPTAVDRAVVNLLDNAVKFSPAGGTVAVRLAAGEYTVADQGPGIDPDDLPHVFERFWRSDSARSLPGSGLGLAIVSQVAEESGGAVALEPAAGGGTVARLRLPGDSGPVNAMA